MNLFKISLGKKGQEMSDTALPMSKLVKILLALIVAAALFFIIRGFGNAALPK